MLKKEGFLLLELLYALFIGLFLYGISIHWQQSIFSIYQETQKGLKALNVAHDTLEHLMIDPTWAQKKEYSVDDITLSWQFNSAFIQEIKTQLPPVIWPKNFQLVSLDVNWPGIGKKHTANFIAGITIHVP